MNGAPDPTRGALYFHHRRISPAWGPQLSRLTTIGAHVYYR
jgi:spore germination cell wall hydrolase CwlJ-like protein